MPHFFISYAKKDTRELALQLNEALNALPNVTAWVDKSLRAGRSWEIQIQTEIDRCDYMIVLYSPDINRHKQGAEESYVLTEISYAKYTAHKPIIPVMAQKTEAPMSLTMAHYIDFTISGLRLDDLITAICVESVGAEFIPPAVAPTSNAPVGAHGNAPKPIGSTSTSAATQNPYLYELRGGQVIFTQNFANTAACAWQGLGGQVFDTESTPLNGLKVHVFGTDFDHTVESGTNSLYGPGGWEVPVDNKISTQTYYVELLSPSGTVVSAQIQVTFPSDCARNVALVNFIQTRATRPSSLDLMPPPFAWIDVPGKGYSIAKYPITNAQFAMFIEAGGYNNRNWWTDVGWDFRKQENWQEPRYWTDAKWNGAEQPVLGVSWYESVAFCLWLSEAAGEKIILPTEDQWQYAAQGDDGRDYPWGNDWICKRCNNSVGSCNSSVTTPVRQYEGKGDSPFGVVDMAGNVGEWCLTDFFNKTNDSNDDAKYRVLRGGMWLGRNSAEFRCDNRHAHFADNGDYSSGFRVSALKIPSSQNPQ